MHVLYNVVCLRDAAFVKGFQSPINVCINVQRLERPFPYVAKLTRLKKKVQFKID